VFLGRVFGLVELEAVERGCFAGVWIGHERVSSRTVGRPGASVRFG
jgi:hypothetical protein